MAREARSARDPAPCYPKSERRGSGRSVLDFLFTFVRKAVSLGGGVALRKAA